MQTEIDHPDIESTISKQIESAEWYAIRTHQESRVEQELSPNFEELFYPKEIRTTEGKRKVTRAIIPHVMFVKTTLDKIQSLERQGREHPEMYARFWVYRYPKDQRMQVIPKNSINLLKLLTANDSTKCEIFRKEDFKENQQVRVKGGPFEGYTGYVQRIRKNKHVLVKIEGICMVVLPFIHPDLLEVIEPTD